MLIFLLAERQFFPFLDHIFTMHNSETSALISKSFYLSRRIGIEMIDPPEGRRIVVNCSREYRSRIFILLYKDQNTL